MLLKPLLKYLAGHPRAHQNTGDAQERHLQHASILSCKATFICAHASGASTLHVPGHDTSGDCESTLLQLP